MRHNPKRIFRQLRQSVGGRDYPHEMASSLLAMGLLAAAPIVLMWPLTASACSAQRVMMGVSASLPGIVASGIITITASPLVRRTFVKAVLLGLLVGVGLAMCARLFAPAYFAALCR